MSATARTPRRRRAALTTAVCAVLALIALLIAATRPMSVRQFILDAPDQQAVAVLKPHETTCEGPIASTGASDQVAIWGASVLAINRMRIDVRDGSHGPVLTSGTVQTTTTAGEYVATLGSAIPAHRPVTICLTPTLNSFSLDGSPAAHPTIVMTHGTTPGLEFSLSLLRSHQTLLGNLSTAFGRASLFRPQWVGSWTFWLLLILVLAGFGLAAVAVAGAASEDDPTPAGDQPGSTASTPRQ